MSSVLSISPWFFKTKSNARSPCMCRCIVRNSLNNCRVLVRNEVFERMLHRDTRNRRFCIDLGRAIKLLAMAGDTGTLFLTCICIASNFWVLSERGPGLFCRTQRWKRAHGKGGRLWTLLLVIVVRIAEFNRNDKSSDPSRFHAQNSLLYCGDGLFTIYCEFIQLSICSLTKRSSFCLQEQL